MELTGIGGEASGPVDGTTPGASWHVAVHARGGQELASKTSCPDLFSRWTNAYGFVSLETRLWTNHLVPEGMNEAGLTVSANTLRQTEYQARPRGAANRTNATLVCGTGASMI